MTTERRRWAEREAVARALRVLVGLRRGQFTAVTRQAARDPLGAAALICLIVVGLVGLRVAILREPAEPAWRLGLDVTAAVISTVALHRKVVRPDTARLADGPLHPLLAQPGVANGWCRLQIALFVGLPAVVLATTLLPDVGGALILTTATACGLVLTLPGLSANWLPTGRRGKLRRAAPRGSLSGPLLIARSQARWREGSAAPIPLGAGLFLVGSAAARLALMNNPGPEIATAVLAATGLGCGALIGALDVEVLRFLGRTPANLASLLAASCLPAAVATSICLVGAGLVIGLGAALATAAALAVLTILGGAFGLTALHALGGHPRFARIAAAIDLVLVAAVVVTFAPAAPVWVIVRAVLLWRSAERGRWLTH